MTKKEEAQKKRADLRALTNELKLLYQMGKIDTDTNTPNALLRWYWQMKGFTFLRTFQEWKKLGYTVKKGQHACLVWGSPISKQKNKDESKENKVQVTDSDFFPLAYLFGEQQVRKISDEQK